jgi:hypothetical protein
MSNTPLEIVRKLSRRFGINDQAVRALAGLSSGVMFVSGGFLGYAIHPIFYSISVIAGVSLTAVMLITRRPRARRIALNRSARKITDAQVFALADHRGSSVTATRLASATNSTVEAAQHKLRDLATDGLLVVDSEQSLNELSFRAPPDRLT